jgi:hypothetical protein
MPEVLLDALRSLGYRAVLDGTLIHARKGNVTCQWESGKGLWLTGNSPAGLAVAQRDILQAYSKTAVSWAAQRAGWQVTTLAPNKMQVTKR